MLKLPFFDELESAPTIYSYRVRVAVFKSMPHQISIVSSSVLSALAGYFGDYHATPRTRNSKLWINPLMPVYWCFQLAHVAQRVLYLDTMKETDSFSDIDGVIKEFRGSLKDTRPRQELPV